MDIENMKILVDKIGEIKEGLDFTNTGINDALFTANRRLNDCYDAIEQFPWHTESLQMAQICNDVFAELGIEISSIETLPSFHEVKDALLTWKNGEKDG